MVSISETGLSFLHREILGNRNATPDLCLLLRAIPSKAISKTSSGFTVRTGPNFSIAFATGGWKETAILKLSVIGIELEKIPLVSSNDHFDRSVITRMAIDRSRYEMRSNEFENITYVGDGLWDLRMAEKLGINFIGIDSQGNNRLISAGATQIVNNLEDLQQIISWAESK